jgi:acylphosphatase
MKTRAQIIIFGEVQERGFRRFVERKALDFNLRGKVKNLENGSVEVIVEGEEQNIREIIKACERGSVFSRVNHAEVKWEDYKNEFTSFRVE